MPRPHRRTTPFRTLRTWLAPFNGSGTARELAPWCSCSPAGFVSSRRVVRTLACPGRPPSRDGADHRRLHPPCVQFTMYSVKFSTSFPYKSVPQHKSPCGSHLAVGDKARFGLRSMGPTGPRPAYPSRRRPVPLGIRFERRRPCRADPTPGLDARERGGSSSSATSAAGAHAAARRRRGACAAPLVLPSRRLHGRSGPGALSAELRRREEGMRGTTMARTPLRGWPFSRARAALQADPRLDPSAGPFAGPRRSSPCTA